MRLLMATGWYLPATVGGTEIYVATLAAWCRRAGHDVRVAAPLAGLDGPVETEHEGIPVLRYPVPARVSRAEARGTTPVAGAAAFVDLCETYRPHIVHAHSLTTGLGLHELAAAARAGAAVIYTNHLPAMGFVCPRGSLLRWGTTPCDGIKPVTTCAACALQARGLPRALASVGARLPQTLARHALALSGSLGTVLGMRQLVADDRTSQARLADVVARVVVLNEAARRIFQGHGMPAGKLRVNRLGIEPSAVPPKGDPDRHPTMRPVRLGFVGRYHDVKGLGPLADALLRLPPDLEYTFTFRGVAASAEERALERELRATLTREPRVAFLPPAAPGDVARALRDLDLLCCPSLWFENGPTVALEAMAVGTPVLASAFGAPAEFIEPGVNGWLVPPGDVAALADGLERIAASPDQTIDRWRRALPPVRRMREVAADYLALYDEVAQEGVAGESGEVVPRLAPQPGARA
jgi:glycosyltransferase involved in cell wall biosynthesis